MFIDKCQCGHGMQELDYQFGHGLAGFTGYDYQRGHGLTGFTGDEYQLGHGPFGPILKFAKPILKYLGRKALEWMGGVATDVVAGDDIKESAKRRLKQTALDITEKGGEQVQNLTQEGVKKAMKFIAQRGSGKRRKRAIVCVPVKKRKITRKRKATKRPRRYKRRAYKKKSKQFDFLQ